MIKFGTKQFSNAMETIRQYAEPEIKTRMYGQKAINFEKARTRKPKDMSEFIVSLKKSHLTESDLKRCYEIASKFTSGDVLVYGNPNQAFPQIELWTVDALNCGSAEPRHTKDDEHLSFEVISKLDVSQVKDFLEEKFHDYEVSVKKWR